MKKAQEADVPKRIDEKMDAFREVCHQKSLKVTPQRMAVYRALLETSEHPSTETVFQQVRQTCPNISLDTVSRTLQTLTEMGVALVVEGSGDVKRFDANLETHQHFKCIRCRRIIDFRHEPFSQIRVPENLRTRYTVVRTTVYLEGFCDLCKQDAH